ncbi:hypothetical protein IJX73_02980 [bacterium]|nr:hypothetical protein [bacterium]
MEIKIKNGVITEPDQNVQIQSYETNGSLTITCFGFTSALELAQQAINVSQQVIDYYEAGNETISSDNNLDVYINSAGELTTKDQYGCIESENDNKKIIIVSATIRDTLTLAQKTMEVCEKVVNYFSCPPLPEVERTDEDLEDIIGDLT